MIGSYSQSFCAETLYHFWVICDTFRQIFVYYQNE